MREFQWWVSMCKFRYLNLIFKALILQVEIFMWESKAEIRVKMKIEFNAVLRVRTEKNNLLISGYWLKMVAINARLGTINRSFAEYEKNRGGQISL